MSVRKRTWTTTAGEQREAWLVGYRDGEGHRRFETFDASETPTLVRPRLKL
jgi:hypothetical protein